MGPRVPKGAILGIPGVEEPFKNLANCMIPKIIIKNAWNFQKIHPCGAPKTGVSIGLARKDGFQVIPM